MVSETSGHNDSQSCGHANAGCDVPESAEFSTEPVPENSDNKARQQEDSDYKSYQLFTLQCGNHYFLQAMLGHPPATRRHLEFPPTIPISAIIWAPYVQALK